MTDIESELSDSNVYNSQNVNTIMSARGPYTNISNFSFRNPMTSTMYNMPRNFERQRYAESVSDQRSIYYRRETSPMSIHSAFDVRPRNFQQHYNGMSSNQSVFNGRSGSPRSIRSIDSSASVSSAYIAHIFENAKYNQSDLRVIKEAYQKLMRQHSRKRIEKRRNMRMFRKGRRNRPQSGDDSGEHASNSSISSDDCRSVKTSYKENMSSSRMTRMDNMLKDCTDNSRQNTFKNIFSVGTSNFKESRNCNSSSFSNIYAMTSQKERFKTGFLLPSQRFNNSVASTVIPKNIERNLESNESNYKQNDRCLRSRSSVSGSEEEIFAGTTARKNILCNKDTSLLCTTVHKRGLEGDEDLNFPDRKRSKKSSPNVIPKAKAKIPLKTKKNSVNNNVDNTNNFEFAKPTLPVRKCRSKMQEKIISKSKQPLTDLVESIPREILDKVEKAHPLISPDKHGISQSQVVEAEMSQACDVSMRPSFIKRKLFTQKLDVAEKANVSSDAISSPQNLYSTCHKEKNKARKLVPTQSCMNREVQGDNNLLDLIHKIVPPDCINKSNQISINQIQTDVNNSNERDDDDTWDVTSIISMCNDNNVSDTFTDEEIFDVDNKKKDKSKNTNNTSYLLRTRNSSIMKPKTIKDINGNVNLAQECRTVNNNIDKEKGKKNNKTNSRPNTRSNSKIKLKAIKSVDENINSPHECSASNKTDKEKSKKTNNTNPYRLTRNSSNIKPIVSKSIDENISLTQDKENSKKTNSTNPWPKTRSNNNKKSNATTIVDENIKSPHECTITNKIDKDQSKKNNNTNPRRITRNNSNIKPKAPNSIDENINPAQDKEKSKKNNKVNHLPKTRNNKNIKPKAMTDMEENVNVVKECRVLITEIPESRGAVKAGTIQKTNATQNTSITKNIGKRSAKIFWDTDFESDAEYQGTPQKRKPYLNFR